MCGTFPCTSLKHVELTLLNGELNILDVLSVLQVHNIQSVVQKSSAVKNPRQQSEATKWSKWKYVFMNVLVMLLQLLTDCHKFSEDFGHLLFQRREAVSMSQSGLHS